MKTPTEYVYRMTLNMDDITDQYRYQYAPPPSPAHFNGVHAHLVGDWVE